ncbi:universal stress protein [Amycolatopsis sp. NPDC059657]|uniref:universal stress protein n=1 Tax=Amycolatopsis sp. NPDC059657 TaxID=3346899 RepID=UPI0036716B17
MDTVSAPVVVAVDGSETARRAVAWAAAEAARRHVGLRIVYAIGLPDISPGSKLYPPPEWFDAQREVAKTVLADAAEAADEAAPGIDVTTEPRENAPLDVLLDASTRAKILVLGEPAGVLTGLLSGSPAARVASDALCPVVIVRGSEVAGPVVVGVDAGAANEAAIEAAFTEASMAGDSLVAVHVQRDDESEPADRALADQLAGWRQKFPDVSVEQVVPRGKPRQRLIDWSAKARLMVVGSRGHGGFAGLLLGSTSHALLHHADCPVMIVRTPERRS